VNGEGEKEKKHALSRTGPLAIYMSHKSTSGLHQGRPNERPKKEEETEPWPRVSIQPSQPGVFRGRRTWRKSYHLDAANIPGWEQRRKKKKKKKNCMKKKQSSNSGKLAADEKEGENGVKVKNTTAILILSKKKGEA